MKDEILEIVRRAAYRVEADDAGFEPLIEQIGDARLVLIGEASHGTHEFYDARAALTRAVDAVMHIDETHALEPLERWSLHEADLPETYPTAL